MEGFCLRQLKWWWFQVASPSSNGGRFHLALRLVKVVKVFVEGRACEIKEEDVGGSHATRILSIRER